MKGFKVSEMSDIHLSIQMALNDGLSIASICYRLGVPYEWVQQVIDDMKEDNE